ncbi:MAG TPA: hypothetical protein VKZ53_06140 [Candidatus Angelobacter sp.]|nr:hypothetical protein [Candidatus Angelobacter sp.]
MPHDSFSLIWSLQILLKAALVVVLVSKKMWRKFPVFMAYATFNLIFGILLYVLPARGHVYYYAYCLEMGASLILGFGVTYEVFRYLLSPYAALRQLASSVFKWAAIVLVLLALVVLYVQYSLGQNTKHFQAFLVVEEVSRIVEVGLLMFLFAFAGVFGLHWRQYVFGIALGLGIFTAVELAGVAIRAYFGDALGYGVAVLSMIAFNFSLLIWMGYLMAPELSAGRPEEAPHRGQLEQWNQAVMELIYQ